MTIHWLRFFVGFEMSSEEIIKFANDSFCNYKEALEVFSNFDFIQAEHCYFFAEFFNKFC